MKKLFIGIDISKDTFNYCFLTEDNELLQSDGICENTKHEIEKFIKQVQKLNYDVWLCMEHTGCYGYVLAFELSKAELCFTMLNPIELKRSMGLVRGKTDQIDAQRIADYALTHKHKIQPYQLPTEELRVLDVQITTRERYVKTLVQTKNSLKALQIVNLSTSIKDEIREHKSLIKRFEKLISNIENRMSEVINSCKSLKVTYSKITKVIGVGPITAIMCIVETANFTKFENARQFSCYCGLAPFQYQSGTSIKGKTKTSRFRDKSMKGVLFKAAGSAIQHDLQLKAYYNKKLKDGKHKLSVINTIANKLVLRIFAVQKREEPFVRMVA